MEFSLKSFRFQCFDVNRTLEFWTGALGMVVEKQQEVNSSVHYNVGYSNDNVNLRFEFEKDDADIPSKSSTASGAVVVVRVVSLDQAVRRTISQELTVLVPPTTTETGARAAVVKDPNGIRVRLLEMDVNAARGDVVPGRLDFVSIPVADETELARALAIFERVPLSRASAVLAGGPSSQGGLLDTARASASFRLVDFERFFEDSTVFVWLGNGPRKRYTSVALVYRSSRLPPRPIISLSHSRTQQPSYLETAPRHAVPAPVGFVPSPSLRAVALRSSVHSVVRSPLAVVVPGQHETKTNSGDGGGASNSREPQRRPRPPLFPFLGIAGLSFTLDATLNGLRSAADLLPGGGPTVKTIGKGVRLVSFHAVGNLNVCIMDGAIMRKD